MIRASMSGADWLVELARARRRAAFAATVTGHYLVIERGLADLGEVAFATRVLTRRAAAPLALPAPAQPTVLPVVKAAGNPYPERVSVGRARNCDVVLRDASVSKLHAELLTGGAALELVDAGSHNGTRLNGRALAAHHRVTVASGDLLQLGNVVARVLDAAGLYDFLR